MPKIQEQTPSSDLEAVEALLNGENLGIVVDFSGSMTQHRGLSDRLRAIVGLVSPRTAEIVGVNSMGIHPVEDYRYLFAKAPYGGSPVRSAREGKDSPLTEAVLRMREKGVNVVYLTDEYDIREIRLRWISECSTDPAPLLFDVADAAVLFRNR